MTPVMIRMMILVLIYRQPLGYLRGAGFDSRVVHGHLGSISSTKNILMPHTSSDTLDNCNRAERLEDGIECI